MDVIFLFLFFYLLIVLYFFHRRLHDWFLVIQVCSFNGLQFFLFYVFCSN